MKLVLQIAITERPDGVIEVESKLDAGQLPGSTRLSPDMFHMSQCVTLGLRAGLEAFAEKHPKGKLFIVEKS